MSLPWKDPELPLEADGSVLLTHVPAQDRDALLGLPVGGPEGQSRDGDISPHQLCTSFVLCHVHTLPIWKL